ncbi:MAG TPA: transketolase [Candidatus Saccharimonadia bacterium]|nr:transketolase [Candidatus Saccharimonadia bacterium]
MTHTKLQSLALEARRIILEQAYRAHTGHIGCALSVVQILTALYFGELKAKSPSDPNRDRFILSKGHAAPALHAILYLKGWISKRELSSSHGNNTYLGVHPEYGLAGVELATGSLGQGLSVATGIALAAQMQKKKFRCFALLSDAECNEGSVWEAAAFAAHHRLYNLTAVIDLNGQQGFGYTKDVLDISPLKDKWRAFGWTVRETSEDLPQLARVLHAKNASTRPTVVIVRTTFGHGVSFMRKKIDWHYLPLSKEQYLQALEEVALERKNIS